MHLPLTTPFHPDGRLNLRKLEQNVARYSLTPAAGIVVLGRNGEADLLTDAETREVLARAIAVAAPTKVMLAGVRCQGVAAALERIEIAAALGYDVAIVEPPAFTGINAAERRVYLQRVADSASLPLLLTGSLPLDLIAELASHPRLLGWLNDFADGAEVRQVVEETSTVKRVVTVTPVFAAVTGRMASAIVEAGAGMVSAASLLGGGTALATAPPRAAMRTRTKEVGFQILAGGTKRMLPALLAGAVGAIPPFAASAPQATYEVMAAWKDGDPALAEEKQARLIEAARLMEEVLGVAGLKYGCDRNGYFGGLPRLPLLPLVADQRSQVDRLMAGLQS